MAISNYRAVLRSAVRGLWSGAIDAAQFDENMRLAISRYLTEAFAAGAKECGIRMDELTVDEQLVLADILTAETAFVAGFATAIQESSRANDGKLTPLYTRLEMWVNRYNDVKNQAKILTCKDVKLEWIYGDVNVHCSTCLKLNGKVKRASQWEASGIYPQRPPNPNLECGGWRCQCTLQQTDKPVSKGPLPRMSQPAAPVLAFEPGIEPSINVENVPDNETGRIAKETVDIINQIHNTENIPEIEIKVVREKSGFGGRYTSKEIQINELYQETQRTSLTHEYGHHLAFSRSRRGVRFDSSLEMKRVLEAIDNSQATKDLKATFNQEKVFENWNGDKITFQSDNKYINYLLDKDEQFARAYAQHIAEKSGNQDMLDEMDFLRKPLRPSSLKKSWYYPVQWEPDDFEPISKAMDDLLESL